MEQIDLNEAETTTNLLPRALRNQKANQPEQQTAAQERKRPRHLAT